MTSIVHHDASNGKFESSALDFFDLRLIV